ncbi:acyltransferase [Bradyrhizobium sp. CCGB12]|uniref:acyltransferase family protein n=1 Tax=Bradyrhizobium sp. CCGB12 TaxID=2949632 RepID=UPI0020B28E6B|nr:acyltransferase [Bradyrhizobium sp. CCGB12]MCP3391791.1 acyltransferase [Bradyrhizobium sp. CCGB12]
MSTTETPPGEITGIQYLRGIAASLVVLDHAASIMELPEFLGPGRFAAHLQYGWIGVDIFFVISGFIIAVTSLQRASLESRLSVYVFALKRFVRIVPFLWFAVGLYASARFLGRGAFEAGPYLNAMFLWPFGEVRPNVVWTLRHEALFYLVFALSFLIVRLPVLIGLWCVAPIFWLFARESLGPLGDDYRVLNFLLNPVNVEFGIGLLIGVLSLQKGNLNPLQSLPLPALLSLILVEFTVADLFGLSAGGGAGALILGPLSGLVLIVALNMKRPTSIIERAFDLLGSASYSIYLMSNIAILGFYSVVLRYLSWLPPLLSLLLAFAFAIAFGLLVHLFVERRLLLFFGAILRVRGKAPAVKVEMAESK